ncbi:putative quinol monooxygenase [Vibrio navarrensis]|uniref:putative quinol monooxygenase n=1 Tax=Vibrio navarrensis TaxID=29495 RepID=UPI001867DF68|nr:antibiotic biosynthesis monooxygenase [Vibrio navarrensis]MBE3654909.1 antibiotic biosynthesis monooxygenase [Vibrio navarrensis]
MSKVTLRGHIIVPDADLAIVKNELPIHEKLTKQESGCLIFEVLQDQSDSSKFNVYEEFIDQNAFDNHQLRVKNSNWGNVTKNVQRFYQISN